MATTASTGGPLLLAGGGCSSCRGTCSWCWWSACLGAAQGWQALIMHSLLLLPLLLQGWPHVGRAALGASPLAPAPAGCPGCPVIKAGYSHSSPHSITVSGYLPYIPIILYVYSV